MLNLGRGSRAAAVALATLLLLPSPPLSGEGSRAATDGALVEDARSYAADMGVSLDEAVRRLGLQVELDATIDAARDAAPDRFAGGWIQHQPDFRLILRFTGESAGLAQVEAIAADAPAPVSIVTGAEHNLADLVAGLDRLAPMLDRDMPDVASGIEIQTGTIVFVSVKPIENSVLVQLQEMAGVPIRVDIGPPGELLHTYGGRLLTVGPLPECTSGFTVRNITTGVRGVTTAAHCDNNLTYWQTGSINYPLTYMGARYDEDQDAQWHKETTHIVYPQFWDGDSYRTVLGLAARLDMPGDYVCHYGIGTTPPGYSCGFVDTIHFDPGDLCGPTGLDPCAATWVKVSGPSLACYGGDSGGPWFSGNNAYGTLQAGLTSGPDPGQCVWATFMSIGFMSSGGMNLEVLLGP